MNRARSGVEVEVGGAAGRGTGGRGERSIRIAMVAACPFPEPRGTPVRILRMAEGLAARGHRVHVVTYHYGTGEPPEELRVHRIPALASYRKHGPGPTYTKLLVLDPLLAGTLWRVLRRERIDVIHAHHTEGLLAAAVARLGARVPLVYDAHTLLASELPYYGLGLPAGFKRLVGRWLDRRLPRMADHVIAVTETIRDRLVGGGIVPGERLSVISNGVEIELFGEPAEPPGGASRRTLIFTGNLARYQGIDVLLRALAEVRRRRSDVRLLIVTESPFDPYESLARELGVRDAIEIVTAGFPQVPRLLAAADVAVNPRTECDGIPLKLLNYMAAGKPVLSFAGAAPGVRHRETGWLVPDGDVSGFAEGAVALLNDPGIAAEIGRRARAYVQSRHSWATTAERTEAVYRELVAARGRS